MDLKLSLDWKAQVAAQAIVESAGKANDIENMSTKTLGMVQESGIYASMLFLLTRRPSDATIASQIRSVLLKNTRELCAPTQKGGDSAGDVLKYLTIDVCSDLHRVQLVRALWEQTLIYARYGAKAKKEGEPKT